MPARNAPQSRQQRRRQQRQQEVARQRRRQSQRRWYIIGGLVVLLVLIGGGGAGAYFAFAHGDNGTGPRPGTAIDGISCQAEMLNYHIHAHLTLYKDGKPVAVPADVGIPYNRAINVNGQNYCLYFLHTHDVSGVIHVESPTPRLYTLGQFFDIWHYTSLWDAQGGLAASAGLVVDRSFVDALKSSKPGEIHVFVDGKPVSTSYRDITLTKHKLITIESGTPLRPPTTHYDFSKVD